MGFPVGKSLLEEEGCVFSMQWPITASNYVIGVNKLLSVITVTCAYLAASSVTANVIGL